MTPTRRISYHRSMTRLAVVAIVVGVSLQCTKPNPLNCADGTCSDPNYPFCDSTAQFQGNVFTCIAVQCTPDAFVACRADQALSCNTVGNDYNVTQCPLGCSEAAGGCVACAANSDCKAPTPKCTTGGSCVQCLLNVDCTSSTAAVCDQASNTCRGCQSDDECPSRACDATTGSCLDESQVIYVVPSAPPFLTCTSLAPCKLADAPSHVSPSRFTIKMEARTYNDSGSAVDFSTGPATIHAEGATFSGQSLSTSSGSGDMTIIGGTFTGSAGVTCNQAAVHLDSVSVSGGNISGTVCNLTASHSRFSSLSSIGGKGCDVHVDTSLFDASSAGVSMGGSLAVQNSVFNGGGISFFNSGGVISFSTFFNSVVTCTDTIQSPPNVVLSNDVHFGTGSGDVVNNCPSRYSILQPQAVLVGTDHIIKADPMFQNAAQGDFHLLLHSPAIDSADPNVSIANDYDGTTRPQGSASDMGAYEYKP